MSQTHNCAPLFSFFECEQQARIMRSLVIQACTRSTMRAFAQWLPAGFETRARRATDGTVHVCLEGSCEVSVGDITWRIQENDVFVVPSWQPLQIHANRDALLFSFSDRPVQTAMGVLREAFLQDA